MRWHLNNGVRVSSLIVTLEIIQRRIDRVERGECGGMAVDRWWLEYRASVVASRNIVSQKPPAKRNTRGATRVTRAAIWKRGTRP